MSNHQSNPVLEVLQSILKWILIVLGTILLIGAATGAILAMYGATYVQEVILPEAEEANRALNLVRSDTAQTSAILYYDPTSGSYQTEQVLHSAENRVWASYNDIPQNLINATVAIEDKRFWEHSGVDWVRTTSAMLHLLTGQRQEGGSTITQQLVKNVTGNTDTTVKRKVLEIFEALEFDDNHTKQETLEEYLNRIYLGNRCYGVYTAAQRYFGKEPGELSLPECASLISITNNPAVYNPEAHPENNVRRRNLVLDQMCEQGYISEQERDAAKATPLVLVRGDEQEEQEEQTSLDGSVWSWYTETVFSQVSEDLQKTYNIDEKTAVQMIYSGGLQIYSCLNPGIQAQLDQVMKNGDVLPGHRSTRGQELISAATVIDNNTGAVVAVVGGVGEKTGNRVWNMATMTLRQPGSCIKPLSVYAPALEMGAVTPDSLVEDSSIRLSNGDLFPKSNSGKKPTGDMVTVEYGVAHSLNTVAAQVLQRVSPQYSFDFVRQRFGVSSLVEGYTGPSGKYYSDLDLAPLSLGGLTKGMSVFEMTGAYGVFARDGIYTRPYVYSVVTDSDGNVVLATPGYSVRFDAAGNPIISGYAEGEPVLKETTVKQMDQMLQAVVTDGTAKSAKLSNATAAGKTGTTDDDFDRWFAGYTENYTAAVWTGYENAETVNYDGNPSVILWKEIMERIN